MAKPGGDAIGRRRVDTHLLALEALGAQIEVSAQEYRMSVRELRKATKMFLDEASVTATENAIMAAVLAGGRDADLQRRRRAARAGPLSPL